MKFLNKEVKELFQKRDKAVNKNDKLLFLSTQLGEIKGSFSEGYLSLSKLETEVLYEVVEDSSKESKVIFVKETYFKNGRMSHQAFLIYHFVNTVDGWKIYKIVHEY